MKKREVPAVELKMLRCEEHGFHPVDARMRTIEVYDDGPASGALGWTPLYAAGWDAAFGKGAN